MSNEMIEKAAKALWDNYQSSSYVQYSTNQLMYGIKGVVTWEYINTDRVIPSVANEYREMARIVIRALKEPPEGYEKIVYHGEYADDVWREMIDEILRN